MSKNYFTDEQVKALAKKSGIDIGYFGDFHELKRLMNLAVETAIGGAVCVAHTDYEGFIAYRQVKKLPKGYRPLYSVKELEN